MYLPVDRSEVTETWLAETLASHQSFSADPIRSVKLEYRGDGLGQLSTLVLADLICDSGSKYQVVIKLHADVPAMHELAMHYGHYESEINFYNHFSDQVPMRTPQVYVAEMDLETERVLLIMESFADWHSPNQVTGATLEEIITATDALAGLTAAFWNAPIRRQYPWIRNMQSDVFESYPSDYVNNTDEALVRLGTAWPGSAEQAARTIGGRCEHLVARLTEGIQAMSLWDYRVENFFYGPDGASWLLIGS